MKTKLSDIRKIVQEEMDRLGTKGVISESVGVKRQAPTFRSSKHRDADVARLTEA